MNLYEKIEQLYQNSGEESKTKEQFSINKQILVELREIKKLLSNNYEKTKKIDKSLMSFVAEFREKLKPDTSKNSYPEVEYKGKILGVNNRGLLYDKETLRLLSTNDAFEVYKYFYQKYLK